MTATGPEASPDAKVVLRLTRGLLPLSAAVWVCCGVVSALDHNWSTVCASAGAALMTLRVWGYRIEEDA